jgi:hemerythrin
MKEFIPWSASMSVGIQEIDQQHKQLLSIINKLYELIIHFPTDNTGQINQILNELVQYTIIHFAVEESLFRIFNYPLYDEHVQTHTDLKRKIAAINEKVQNGDKKVTLELMTFLRKWLRNHIMIEDKKYEFFFINESIAITHKNKSWFAKILDSIH